MQAWAPFTEKRRRIFDEPVLINIGQIPLIVLFISVCAGCSNIKQNEVSQSEPSAFNDEKASLVPGTDDTVEGVQNTVSDIRFDFENKTVTLNSGYEMPINGIGTYCLLDEVSVGEAVRNSGIPREEIFVTTKLYPSRFSNPEAAINEALEKLNIGYIDLMLLHHLGEGDVKAYKAMEKAVEEGKIRSIGLKWYVEELEEFLPQISITPALIQNEIHSYYQENDVIPYIQSLGIVMQGWYPLGGRGYTAELLGNEVISEIARMHGKSSAQVILRWNLQKGVVVIPGSSNPDHIQENTELYDFELTEEDMEKINALDRNEKHDWY